MSGESKKKSFVDVSLPLNPALAFMSLQDKPAVEARTEAPAPARTSSDDVAVTGETSTAAAAVPPEGQQKVVNYPQRKKSPRPSTESRRDPKREQAEEPAPMKQNPLLVETRSRRVQLIFQPSLYKRIKALADKQSDTKRKSFNDYVHAVLEDHADREG